MIRANVKLSRKDEQWFRKWAERQGSSVNGFIKKLILDEKDRQEAIDARDTERD